MAHLCFPAKAGTQRSRAQTGNLDPGLHRGTEVAALLRRGSRVLLGGLLGAEDVASVGPGGHRLPGAGGAQAAVADIVEGGLVRIGASLGGAGGIEIMLCGHKGFLFPP